MIYRAVVLCSVLLASAAISAAPDFDYAAPHQRIDIGGRKLNLFCAGEGAPTVVFEAPGAFGAWNWLKVQGKVAAHTRACVYDRAGYGFSDSSGRPADSKNAVEDLHALLKAAKVPGPYLLVGSSYGAMHTQLYAYSYPAEVAGMVLIDGESEDEDSALDAVTGGKMSQFDQQAAAWIEACTKQAQAGKMDDQCPSQAQPGLDPKLAAVLETERASPVYWHTRQSESASYKDASSRELREARRSFGQLPVLILNRTVSPFLIPGQPQSDMNKAAEAAHRKTLEAIVALSARGELRDVPEASHLIQFDQPNAVSDAVIDMVKRLH